jgi:hypothetical protein
MAAPAIRLERDDTVGGTRVFIPHDLEDHISIRRERRAPQHFDAFLQLSVETPADELLELEGAELRVWLVLALRMDRHGNSAATTGEIAERTRLASTVVSRTLTRLWRRDLIRPTGRTRAGRHWALTPRLVYRGPGRASDEAWCRWGALEIFAGTGN